jgi:hypothetical protein
MRLYTEEQVKKAIQLADKLHYLLESQEESIISLLTPIELPSEEELAKEGLLIFKSKKYNIYTHYKQVHIWIEGARWIINQIKQQDNGK